jgi:cell division protein FtsL
MLMRLIMPALLSGAVLASAFAVVYAQHQSRKFFVELETLGTVRDELESEWSKLQLEQSTLATHGRVEQYARTHLDMSMPAPDSIHIVEP